ncbi:MAG: hypothetical protein AAGE52_05280 [Myxococcota bacterium]
MRPFLALVLLSSCTQQADLVQLRRNCLESGQSTLAVDASATLRALVRMEAGYAVFFVDERQLQLVELDEGGVPRTEPFAVGSGNNFRQLSAVRFEGGYRLASNRFVDGRRQIFLTSLVDGDVEERQFTEGFDGGDDGFLDVQDDVVLLAYRARDEWVVVDVESGAERLRVSRDSTDTEIVGFWPNAVLGRDVEDFVVVGFDGTEQRLGPVAQDDTDEAIAAAHPRGWAAAYADGQTQLWGPASSAIAAIAGEATHVALAVDAEGADVVRVTADGVRLGDALLVDAARRSFAERLGGGVLVGVERVDPRVELYRVCE